MSGLDRFRPARLGARAVAKFKQLLGLRTLRLYQSAALVPSTDTAGELTRADSNAIAVWRDSMSDFPWTDRETIELRLAEGHQLWSLHSQGRPVCYGWISVTQRLRLDEVNGDAVLAAPVTWIWDCVTPRSQRGHGNFARFLSALRQRFHPLAVGVEPGNQASLKSIERAGFRAWAKISVSPFGPRTTLVDASFGPLTFHKAVLQNFTD